MKIFTLDKIIDHITLVNTPLLGCTKSHDLPFHLEKDRWNFVLSPQEADIIPIMSAPFYIGETEVTIRDQLNYINGLKPNQWLIIMFHSHASDEMNNYVKCTKYEEYLEYHKNIIVVDLNRKTEGPNFIFNDFCFNLIKAYFTEYDNFDLHLRLWTGWCTKKSFTLQEIKEFNLTKRFLVPNIIRNTHEFKEFARARIKKEIIDPNDCFYSDVDTRVALDQEEINPDIKIPDAPLGVGITPIASRYYTESAVSVYTETICTEKHGVNVISEKTFIPLIRGHYILPFGYRGLIRDIKSYGFKLPDWIDYSYDKIYNDQNRLDSFLNSVTKLRSLTLNQLTEYTNRDIELLNHNRNLFFTRPYDSLYDKIQAIVNQ